MAINKGWNLFKNWRRDPRFEEKPSPEVDAADFTVVAAAENFRLWSFWSKKKRSYLIITNFMEPSLFICYNRYMVTAVILL